MIIPQDKIAQIRDSNPIEEVIGSYIPLKRGGKGYKAICPFHLEKTPSFYVSPDKGVYHCFGCGKSGNVFSFLMEYNNLTYYEAVKFLADRVGIQIELVDDENVNFYKANEFVAHLYHSVLLSAKGVPGRRWLESRGILSSTVDKFILGYAPDDSIILDKAKEAGINKEDLEILGLIRGVRDTFRRKVIFPIKNRWGKVSGFGTRVLDNSEPKYINSQESPIFKKGELLYGVYEARNELKSGAILVEGYMDLLTVYQSGVRNIVASLGTSLTAGQARLLKLYTPKVTVLYDGDLAGRSASERAIDVLLESGLEVDVLPLPDGEDPDSFVRKNGRLDFSHIKNFVDFKFKECKDASEKEELIKSFQQTLSKIADPVKKELWTVEVAHRLGIRKELLFVERMVPLMKRVKSKKNLEDLEVELLGIAVAHPSAMKLVAYNSSDIRTPELKSSLSLVLRGASVAEIIDSLPNERLRQHFIKPSFWEGVDYEKIAADYLKSIRERRSRLEREELKNKIKENSSPELLLKYQNLKKQVGG